MPDLPVIPCYKSDNCGNIKSCGIEPCPGDDGTDLCLTKDVFGDIEWSGLYRGDCWGNESNSCDGVLSRCDPSDGKLFCEMESNYPDPALSTSGLLMGCKINNSESDCMEFLNFDDSLAVCSDICWDAGGRMEVSTHCQTMFKDPQSCNAMRYFCEWNDAKNSCRAVDTITNSINSPRGRYIDNYGSHPPKNSHTLVVSTNCSGVDPKDCITVPEGPLDVEKWNVTCSQSEWDSTKRTSFDPDAQICCLDKNDGSEKKCIATPRCQYVENTCECGFKDTKVGDVGKDHRFMCAKKVFYIEPSTSVGDSEKKAYVGTGYCTWCKNQQNNTKYTLPDSITDTYPTAVTRNSEDWAYSDDSFCPNRCENYSNCEADDSEELWNSCVWRNSSGEEGINPNSLIGLSREEKRNEFRRNGFCFNTSTASQAKKDLLKKCEDELQSLGSINGGRVFSPSSVDVVGCQYRYNWNHHCIDASDGNAQVSENYLCTWCPSLQCKVGKMTDICATESVAYWDHQIYCTTNNNYGDKMDTKWPDDCGCYYEGRIQEDPVFMSSSLPDILVGSVSVSVVVSLIIFFIFL